LQYGIVVLIMGKVKFDSIEKALEWCFNEVKPSKMDEKIYKKFNVYRHRYNKDRSSLKANAINSILDHFNVKQICTYEVNIDSKKKEPAK